MVAVGQEVRGVRNMAKYGNVKVIQATHPEFDFLLFRKREVQTGIYLFLSYGWT